MLNTEQNNWKQIITRHKVVMSLFYESDEEEMERESVQTANINEWLLVSNRIESMERSLKRIENGIDKLLRTLKLNSSTFSSDSQRMANGAIGNGDCVSVNGAMLNIERRKIDFYNTRRDTVFRLTRLYAECEDYRRSIFNDVLLKLQLETIRDVTGTLYQLRDHMYAKTSIVKHIIDLTGDSSDEEDKDHEVVDLALDSTHEDEDDESIDLAHDSTYEDEEDEDDDEVVV